MKIRKGFDRKETVTKSRQESAFGFAERKRAGCFSWCVREPAAGKASMAARFVPVKG
ncbi:MAG: hypothetical protein HFE78_06545 [Clostridiales bacterium]|nr:hypothetical protein [Clostridiales bacterium]